MMLVILSQLIPFTLSILTRANGTAQRDFIFRRTYAILVLLLDVT